MRTVVEAARGEQRCLRRTRGSEPDRIVGRDDDQRPRPLAVRDDEHLPLPVRAGDDRAGVPGRAPADGLVPQRQARVQAPDEILRDAAADQRRGRGRHRPGAGVRVRDELVGLLALRRRRVRRAAGDGGPGGVLPGVHVPRAVALRLGQASQARSPRLHLAGRDRDDALGDVHPGRQLVDAAPGRLCAQQPRSAGTEQHLGAVHQPDVPVGLCPRDPGLAGHRLAGDARGLGVAPAQSSARSSPSRTRRGSR